MLSNVGLGLVLLMCFSTSILSQGCSNNCFTGSRRRTEMRASSSDGLQSSLASSNQIALMQSEAITSRSSTAVLMSRC